MCDFGVSIINFRTAEMTCRAAASVVGALGARDAVITIVDNASGDGSAERIADWIATQDDPRLRFLRSEVNGGFAAGHNLGMAAAPEAEFHLILNSDALLRPGFFDSILKVARARTDAGLIAPRLEDEDGTVQISLFRFASPGSELIRGAGSGPVTTLLRRHVVSLGTNPDPEDIDWASFACVLLRGEMVREIGPMDEGYFLYFEDAEYALRARRAGWRIAVAPEARAVHFRGGSGPVKMMQKARKRLPDYYWRSRARFLAQAYGPLGPAMGNLGWAAGRGLTQLRRLGGKSVYQPHEGEWRDIWTGMTRPLAGARR